MAKKFKKFCKRHFAIGKGVLLLCVSCALIASVIKNVEENYMLTLFGSFWAVIGTYLEENIEKEKKTYVSELVFCDIATAIGAIMLMCAVYLN